MDGKTCETCQWFDPVPLDEELGNHPIGMCVIRSTRPYLYQADIEGGGTLTMTYPFPPRFRPNFCGEHQPKEKHNEAE